MQHGDCHRNGGDSAFVATAVPSTGNIEALKQLADETFTSGDDPDAG